MTSALAQITTISKPNPSGTGAFSHFQYELNVSDTGAHFAVIQSNEDSVTFTDIPSGTYVVVVIDVDGTGNAMDQRTSAPFDVTGSGDTYDGVDTVSVTVS